MIDGPPLAHGVLAMLACDGDLTNLTRTYTHIKPRTIEPDWYGTPLDLPHATDVFLAGWAKQAKRRQKAAAEPTATAPAPAATAQSHPATPWGR